MSSDNVSYYENSWEQFFTEHLPPSDYEDNRSLLKEFCERHSDDGRRICLVTSGGTIVPLEHSTVRFVDNFSAGIRGAASAEYFLELGYAVIFLHRAKSLEPFTRHLTLQRLFDMLHLDCGANSTTITVTPDSVDVLAPILLRYKAAHAEGTLLYVTFSTVSEYLWLVRGACEYLSPLGPRALLYLAAAVSDFYIPEDEVPLHKMPSEDAPPPIRLQLVPKMLTPLVSVWVPRAYVVSFKLETDEGILISKARAALDKYMHKLHLVPKMLTPLVSVWVPRAYVVSFKLETDEGILISKARAALDKYMHKLHLVPKMLTPLVSVWVPRAYVVSFKLETDEGILISKARAALDKYMHKLVIANTLHSRRQRVVLVSRDSTQEIVLTREEVHAGEEIECPLVDAVVRGHSEYLCAPENAPSEPQSAPSAPQVAPPALVVLPPPR